MTLASLATTDDLTARGITTGADDETALVVASALIREAAGNCITQLTSAVTVPAPRGKLLTLPGPVTAVSSLTVDGITWTLGDEFYIEPNGVTATQYWDPWDRPVPVAITFTHGLDPVPDDIVDLCCALAAQWKAASAAGFTTDTGITSARVDDYSEARTPEASGQATPVWIPESTRAALRSRFAAFVSVEMG